MKQPLDILRTRLSKNRRIIALLLAAVILTAAAGCKKEHPPLRIGTNVWPGYEPLYLADALGYLDKNRFQLVEFPSSSGVINSIVNHSIDGGALTMDEVLRLADRNIPVRVILILDTSSGGDAIVAKPEIGGMKGLKGRRVAVESTALGAYVLSRALTLNGMTTQDVTVKNTQVSEHERVFTAGEIDAVVTFDPVRSILVGKGGQEIFTSREIPGEIVDVLAIHEQHLGEDRETLKMLVGAWYKALDYMQKNPADAARIMSRRLHISPDEVARSFAGLNLPGREETARLMKKANGRSSLYAGTEELYKLMRAQGLIGREIAVEDLIYPGFLD